MVKPTGSYCYFNRNLLNFCGGFQLVDIKYSLDGVVRSLVVVSVEVMQL